MGEPPKLVDRMRAAIRTGHYGRRTEEAYVGWVKRFIFFHHKKHPAAMGADEVNAFLSYLAVERGVSASTQSQALCALLFLYRHVLDDPLRWMNEIVRAQRRERLPLVLVKSEVRRLLGAMEGTPRLLASVLYGGGLRLLEALRLRVKDVDFAANMIVVRQGKETRIAARCCPKGSKNRCGSRSSLRAGFTRRTSDADSARSGCRMRWRESTRTQRASFPGNGHFRRRDCGLIP